MKNGHAGEGRDGLLKELQPFPLHLNERVCQSCDVPAWAGEAGDQSASNGVDDPCHHDGNRAGGLLRRPDLYGTIGNHEVRLETHELSRERQGSLILIFRPPALEEEILPLGIPALSQPGYECLPFRTANYWAITGVSFIITRGDTKVPDTIDLLGLLSFGIARSHEDA